MAGERGRSSWRAGVLAGIAWALGSPAMAAPIHTLAELKQHPEASPAQVTLKSDTRLVIISGGKEVGAIVSPAGSTVNLLSVGETTIKVGVGSASASVSPGATDLWQRLAASFSASALVPVTAKPAAAPLPRTPAAVAAVPAPAPAAAVSSVPPLSFDEDTPASSGFTKAAFHLWAPADVPTFRGIIVLVPGLNGDGRGMSDDPAWQALARKYRLALVSCFMQGKNYYEAPRGSGDALLRAISSFARESNHPEIAHIPLLLYGESAGGQFDYDFVLWKPEEVMAFVVNKGGYYNQDTPESRTRSVPGLFFLGQSDSDLRIKAITAIWTEGRRGGALWALAPQPDSGHEFSKTPAMARVFFESVLKNRLPDEGADPDPTFSMKPMEEAQGWLGDLQTHEIQAETPGVDGNLHASWLPDQSAAETWKVFVSGGG